MAGLAQVQDDQSDQEHEQDAEDDAGSIGADHLGQTKESPPRGFLVGSELGSYGRFPPVQYQSGNKDECGKQKRQGQEAVELAEQRKDQNAHDQQRQNVHGRL